MKSKYKYHILLFLAILYLILFCIGSIKMFTEGITSLKPMYFYASAALIYIISYFINKYVDYD